MKRLRYLLILCLVISGFRSEATHLVGGEISLQHLRGSQFLLTLKVYFDASGNAAANDPSVDITSFTKNGNSVIETFTLPQVSRTVIPSGNSGCGNTGRLFYDLRYEAVVSLNDGKYRQSGGYYLSWERCCRNNAINNIIAPGQTGMVYYMEMPSLAAYPENSSPIFSPVSADFLCQGKPYQFSFGAADADGDQLVYSLVTPLRGHTDPTYNVLVGIPGPYSPVFWDQNAATSPIPGNPSLSINSTTGMLSVTPDNSGLYVFSVRCQEFRNGLLLGEVRRDYQWYVLSCQTNPAPAVSLATSNGTPLPGTDTLLITDNTNNCFELLITDPSINEQVTVTGLLNGQPGKLKISPNQGKLNGSGDTLKARICWPDCAITSPDPYEIKIIVQDDACPASNQTEFIFHVKLEPDPNALPEISLQPALQTYQVTIGEEVLFDVTGTDSDADLVSLTAEGVGFTMSAYGMNFPPVSATGQVKSTFRWVPDCNALRDLSQYQVRFIARDNSCFAHHSDTIAVTFTLQDVVDGAEAFLPSNIFTPNGDGQNDYFTLPTLPKDNCQDQFSTIEVFNRWGNRVFQSTSRDFKWNGGGLADGLYYYLISYEKKAYKGYLTLMNSKNQTAP